MIYALMCLLVVFVYIGMPTDAAPACEEATDAQVALYKGVCSYSWQTSTNEKGVTTKCYTTPVCDSQCKTILTDSDGNKTPITVDAGKTFRKEPTSKKVGQTTYYQSGYEIVCTRADTKGVKLIGGVFPPPTYTYKVISPDELQKKDAPDCEEATDAQVALYKGVCSLSWQTRTDSKGVTTKCYAPPGCATTCQTVITDGDGNKTPITVEAGKTFRKEPTSKKVGNTTYYQSGYEVDCKRADTNGVKLIGGVYPPPTATFTQIAPNKN